MELLYVAKDAAFAGDVHVRSFEVNVELGDSGVSRAVVPLDIGAPKGTTAALALIEMVVESQGKPIGWKLKLEGMNVAREFKPLLSVREGGRTLHKLVYDVTSLLNTPRALGKSSYALSVRHVGGDNAKIRGINAVVVLEYPGASSALNYLTGFKRLAAGESFEASFNLSGGEAYVHAAFVPLGRGGRVRVCVDDVCQTDHAVLGEYEPVVVGPREGLRKVWLKYEGSRDIFLSSLLAYGALVPEPSLRITSYEVEEHGSTVKIRARISNVGAASPDHSLVTALSAGNVLGVSRIGNLAPGAEEDVVLNVGRPANGELVLRVVWRKLARVRFAEARIAVGGRNAGPAQRRGQM
ncbi:MAG: CARDB domain-containing protein [Desulfurococcaceae archaeon]